MKPWEIVSDILTKLREETKPGVTLLSLNTMVEMFIEHYGARSCNKGYMGEDDWDPNVKPKEPFPTALVVNVNSTIAHGHATEYVLKEGDIVCFDIGLEKDGLCGDAAFTMGVGTIENKYKKLIDYSKRTTLKAISEIKPGVSLAYIGGVIERFVASRGYVVNEVFASHGIGSKMHEEPTILHYFDKSKELELFEEGKMYCIEPILTFKDRHGMRATDWGFITQDGGRCAMFEHQILVTKDGVEILTTHI